MQFFSGFSLKNEEHFFQDYLDGSELSIAGFSYGAIKAFEYTRQKLQKGERVDRLQLLSPAFFQTKELQFKRLQILAYKKNQSGYLHQFIDSCFSPYERKKVEQTLTSREELQELLAYEWSLSELMFLRERGVRIEVYLGAQDKIVDAKAAEKFFLDVATVTYIKDANHFLQIN